MEEEMDVSQYLEIFLDETNEHLQNLNTQILELESDPENMDNINEIFRAAHSLKGMAGTMGYNGGGSRCQGRGSHCHSTCS